MKDRNAQDLARALKPWQETLAQWQAFADGHSMTLEIGDPRAPHYRLCRLTKPGVRIVIYPHRQTSGDRLPRARDENSTDKAEAERVLIALGLPVKNRPDLTFSCSHDPAAIQAEATRKISTDTEPKPASPVAHRPQSGS